MKRSQDYYHNRKMLKTLVNDKIIFRPKTEDMKEWFVIINEQVFGNKLEPVTKLRVKNLEYIYGFYGYFDKKNKRYGRTQITVTNKFPDKKTFVEILAHEMIHHFQNSYNEPVGHGPSFTAWNENFKIKGIKLYKVT
jgi:hypothetical protein